MYTSYSIGSYNLGPQVNRTPRISGFVVFILGVRFFSVLDERLDSLFGCPVDVTGCHVTIAV
ncbi:unnamed protein product [Schistosoma mattheei]|uniref:Uncharacterized protein n=1 Tax=Schistosoma mattheei TaxID=31246 RepID=A0A3P8AWG2_9TREM|nr:unnamed protein product [Schistosoma mattheei]